MSQEKSTLTPAEYWELLSHLNQKLAGAEIAKASLTQANYLEAQVKIAKLQSELFRATSLRNSKKAEMDADREYNSLRARLSEKYNVDLSKCSIDEFTYEINVLEQGDKGE